MPSVVDIANMALSRIGNSQRINSLDEASLQAEQCNLFYEQARDFVLRDYPWGFATAFVELAQVTVNPDPRFLYAYAQPQDCLKIRGIVNQAFSGADIWCWDHMPRIPRVEYRVIHGQNQPLIATNASPATLEYTVRIEAPETFDPIFVSALAWKLASQIAPAISRDGNAAQLCEAAYQGEIRQAAAAAMNESAAAPRPESSFITGRE